jgi:hypothetical protein
MQHLEALVVAASFRSEVQRSVEVGQRRGSDPERLVDGVPAQLRYEVQSGECRVGQGDPFTVTDQFRRDPPSPEREP